MLACVLAHDVDIAIALLLLFIRLSRLQVRDETYLRGQRFKGNAALVAGSVREREATPCGDAFEEDITNVDGRRYGR